MPIGCLHIIAPIRQLGEAKRKATCQDAADVAEALVNIRTYFMPKSRSGKLFILNRAFAA
ncbi:hypothetical protein GOA59_20700 [Sinorhizobium meliloti]|nr:hypothetical protein [Sinorhizobium meliloti]MDW9605098.1 hypothetical protein [Sinorhizobium meliloti]MDW9675197.1 hypothetical protein [Sinorhizobium meliloti]MDW9951848.1 hypothetical protein [Sinorhizobium meliloti]MDX0018793.1 hypothetical protein [Sinorhizobium meliloti]